MRIRGYDEEGEKLEDYETLKGEIASLTKTAKTPGGISLFTDESKTTFKSTYQLLKEISEIYDELSDKDQAKLLEVLAGKRGGQIVASVLGDGFGEVERALEEMTNAAGSADKEMEIVQSSITYKLNYFKQTWTGILTDLVERGDVGILIDSINGISDALGGLIDLLPNLPTLVGGVASIIHSIKADSSNQSEGINLFGFNIRETIGNISDIIAGREEAPALGNVQNFLDELNGDTFDASRIREVAEANHLNADAVEELARSTNLANLSAEELTNTLSRQERQQSSQIRTTRLQTIGTNIATKAFQALKAAASSVLWAGVFFAITKAAEALYNYINREKIAIEQFKELKSEIDGINSSYKDNEKFITENADSYIELSKGVDKFGKNISLTSEDYEKYLQLNKDFAEKFPSLIQGFNNQGIAILDIGKNSEETTNKLKEQLKYQEMIANVEIGKRLPDLQKNLNTKRGMANNAEKQISEYAYNRYIDFVDDIISGEKSGNNIALGSFNFSKNSDASSINKLSNVVRSFIDDNNINLDLSDVLKDEGFGNNIRQYYLDLSQLSEENKALLFTKLVENKNELLKEFSITETESQKIISDYESSFASTLSAIVQASKVGMYQIFDEDTQGLMTSLIGSLDSSILDGIEDGDLNKWVEENIIAQLNAIGENKRQEITDSYMSLLEINWDEGNVSENSKKLSDFINLLVYNGFKDVDKFNLGEIFGFSSSPITLENRVDTSMKNIATQNGRMSLYGSDAEEEYNTLLDFKDKELISPENYEIFLKVSVGAKSATEAILKYKEAVNSVPNEPISNPFDEDALTTGTDHLSSIYELYKKFKEDAADGVYVGIDISELKGLDEEIKSVEGFNEFKDVLANSAIINTDAFSTKMAEVNSAFTTFATNLVDAKIKMGEISATDIELVSTQLQLAGATKESADAWAQNRAEMEKARSVLGNMAYMRVVGQDAQYSASQIENMAQSANVAKGSIYALLIQQIAFENDDLNASQKVAALYQIASAAGVATAALGGIGGGAKHAGKADEYAAKAGQFEKGSKQYQKIMAKAAREREKAKGATIGAFAKELQKLTADASLEFKTPASSGGGGGGGGGGKDEAEEKKDIMSELSSQLDEIQSKWESLNAILKDYNETGKVTVDQAQELFNTDFKYLALLGDGVNTVDNIDEAYQRLAEAKMNEMKIQLARNAIDAINNLKTEADAVNYLTNAHKDLAEASLDATEQLLKEAVAAAKLENVKKGEAAEMIYRGYQNAIKLTANVDYSKKEDDKDKEKDKEKDEEKKEKNTYKKELNWIERLLDKLHKTTEKLTDKVDKFFTYWNKNAAANKAIEANAKEQEALLSAYQYYEAQADKVKLNKKWKDKVDNGAILYETISREGLGKKIEEYQKWKEAAEAVKEQLEETYQVERDLIKQKLDNIVSYFDTIENYYNSILSKFDSQLAAKNAWGNATTLQDLAEKLNKTADTQKVAQDKIFALETGTTNDLSQHRTKEEIDNDIDDLQSGASKSEAAKALDERWDVLTDKSKLTKKEQKELDLINYQKDALSQYDIRGEDTEEFLDLIAQKYEIEGKRNKKTGKLSTKNQKKLDEIEAKIAVLRQNYQNEYNNLSTEAINLALAMGEVSGDSEEHIDSLAGDLSDSYDKQIDEVQNGYKDNAEVQKFTEKAEKTKGEKKKAKNNEILSWLEKAATPENASEVLALAKKAVNNPNTKAGKAALAELQKLAKAKEEEVKALQTEKKDAVEEFKIESNTTIEETQGEIADTEADVAEIIKEMINFHIAELQKVLDALDLEIEHADNVLSLLSNSGIESVQKYNLGSILGIDDDGTFEEVFTQKTEEAVNNAKEKLKTSGNMIGFYQDLIKSIETGDWEAVLSKWEGLIDSDLIESIRTKLAENVGSESEWLPELKKSLNDAESAAISTIDSISKHMEDFRENVLFKMFNDALERLNSYQSTTDKLAGLIKDDWMFDVNGITEYGLGKIEIYNHQLDAAREKIDAYEQKINEIDKLGENDLGAYSSAEEKQNALVEAAEGWLSAMQEAISIEDKVVDIGRQIQEQEVETLKKTISLYKESLAAKKSYYDYDKNIQEKNKNILALEAQIKALTGVTDAYSKSKKKQLEEQLSQANEDMEDLKIQHEFDLQNQALDELVATIDEALDRTTYTITEKIAEYADKFVYTSDLVNSYNDLNTNITESGTQIAGSITTSSENTANALTTSSETTGGAITTSSENTAKAVTTSSETSANAVTTSSENTAKAVTTSSETAANALITSSENFSTGITNSKFDDTKVISSINGDKNSVTSKLSGLETILGGNDGKTSILSAITANKINYSSIVNALSGNKIDVPSLVSEFSKEGSIFKDIYDILKNPETMTTEAQKVKAETQKANAEAESQKQKAIKELEKQIFKLKDDLIINAEYLQNEIDERPNAEKRYNDANAEYVDDMNQRNFGFDPDLLAKVVEASDALNAIDTKIDEYETKKYNIEQQIEALTEELNNIKTDGIKLDNNTIESVELDGISSDSLVEASVDGTYDGYAPVTASDLSNMGVSQNVAQAILSVDESLTSFNTALDTYHTDITALIKSINNEDLAKNTKAISDKMDVKFSDLVNEMKNIKTTLSNSNINSPQVTIINNGGEAQLYSALNKAGITRKYY